MSIKKSSLQQALLEAKEIEKAAYENAKKILEESIAPKIEEAVKESLKSLSSEKETVEEGIEINVASGADLAVNVESDGTATVSVDKKEEDINSSTSETEISNNNIESMEDNMNEEIFEVEGLNEVDAEAPAAPAEAPAEAPVAPTEETPAAEEAPVESGLDIESELAQINKKLDALIADEAAEGGEVTAPAAEGEIEIVDDETASAETPIETAAAPATDVVKEDGNEVDMEEVVYEIENDIKDTFDSVDELEEIEITGDDLDEIEIIDDEEEKIDESGLGVGNAVQRQANQHKKFNKGDRHHAPTAPVSQNAINESEIKAQDESEIDELKKENESLKETIKEYKDSFIVLRKQINEIQTFNAKLAYANKLFTNGGLTNAEKIRIAEEFDKVETIEESKKLYNKLLSEFNSTKATKDPIEKLKSVKPAMVTSNTESTAKPLYESDEMKRMKKLAGIIK